MPSTGQGSPSLWTRLPQSSRSPCDRHKHACCSHNGHVYVLGGRDTRCLRDFWRYSVVCNEWTELSCGGDAAPEELEEHSMVAHQGFLYVFGGMLDSAFSQRRRALWVFDVAKQKWVSWQRKTSSSQTPMPCNRKGHSAVVLGSAMLLYGGLVDMRGSSQDFWSLDLDTVAWAQLSQRPGSLAPGPRHSHSAMVHQDCMYLFGGLRGLREQRDFWKWSSTSRLWTALRTKSGPSRLTGHSAVAYRDAMLLFGGGESQDSPNNFLWRYSFGSQSWAQVAWLPGSAPPDKIHHCCAGLGQGYASRAGATSAPPQGDKSRPFRNKCFPAPSEGAIELQTFSLEPGGEGRPLGYCLTSENKENFRKTRSGSEEEERDAALHLPDLLLVLGGRPRSREPPMSVWQMTLSD